MNKIFKVLFMLSALSLLCFAQAKQTTTITKDIVELNENGAGKKVGTVTVTETANGTSISVEATSLKVDAIQVELHLYGKNSPKPKDKSGNLVIGGGLGDDMENLGYLMVDADGSVNQAIECGLKHSDIKGKSLVITEDVSGYADNTQTKKEPLYVAIF